MRLFYQENLMPKGTVKVNGEGTEKVKSTFRLKVNDG